MQPLSSSTLIQLGQRIYTSLYSRGFGTVVKIDGEQAPGSVRNGGGLSMGGRASFDIAFDSGQSSTGLPESILRGVQWTVLDEVVSAEQVAAAIVAAEMYKASESQKKAKAEAAFAAAVEALRTDPAYSHLTQLAEKYDSNGCTKNIRGLLKKAFPGVKFGVTRKGNSVNIKWTDGPTDALVTAATKCFEAGSFDGMQDCYIYERSPWTEVFGSVSYVFTRRDYSAALVSHAIAQAFDRYGDSLENVNRPVADDYHAGRCWNVRVSVPGLWRVDTLSSLIGHLCDATTATAEGFATKDDNADE
jgi:hypothetical protein